jgi:hypothetical protein
MHKRLLTTLLLAGFALAMAPAADTLAGGNQGNKAKHSKAGTKQSSKQTPIKGFAPRDRDIISSYYRNRQSSLPPGLAKRGGQLPPGLERQLNRNGTLPPGLQKHIEIFPSELDRQLPPLPAGYVRGLIGGSAVVVDRRSGAILDVIQHLVIQPGR